MTGPKPTMSPLQPLRRPALLLGFALGGFFDGILLHQVLQWHHLLSTVRGGLLGDLRGQVMADGLFHALMYVVAAVGLWQLLAARRSLGEAAAGRAFLGAVLVGFGGWHAVDAVFSHWLTGIHHIRMDVDNPLPWDIGWLVVFGLVPIALGVAMLRRSGTRGAAGRDAVTLSLLLASTTLASGWLAARPVTDGPGTVAVVLAPGATAQQLLQAVAHTDTRIVGSDASGRVWVLAPDPSLGLLQLYRHGAMYVSGALTPAGCSAWLQRG